MPRHNTNAKKFTKTEIKPEPIKDIKFWQVKLNNASDYQANWLTDY